MHNISTNGFDANIFFDENQSQQFIEIQDSSIVPHEQQNLSQEYIGLSQEHQFDLSLQPSDWSQQHIDFNQFHDEWGQPHTDWNQQYQNPNLNEQIIDINHNQDYWGQEHQANLSQPHEADWSQANQVDLSQEHQAELNSQSSHCDYQYQDDLISQDRLGGNVQPRSAADDMQEKADLLKQAADKEAEAKQLTNDVNYWQSPGHNFIDKAAEAAQKAAEAQAEAERLRKQAE